ncbi:MAG: Metalloprotease LoiP precursor [Pseudomonadota bacterium]|jgi:Zn-dependent protease with chaperone function
MCWLCEAKSALSHHHSPALPTPAQRWLPRRGFLLAGTAGIAGLGSSATLAQVDVGKSSAIRTLVPAEQLEGAARQQYAQMIEQARAKGALAPESHPQLQALRAIARRLIPHAAPWNGRSRDWQWEVNLIGSSQLNAFCMPGGKIVFFTGILDKLKLGQDEAAMIMGHEMAHALREHARERLAKTQATSLGLSLGARLLGLGELGEVAADLGTQLLSLKYSRDDETEADLVGLELAARGAFDPQASVMLWRKMMAANGGGGPAFLSTHPSGPNRIEELQQNIPKVQPLYERARG